MDYKGSHKSLLLSLINSENNLFLTEANTYFDTPTSIDSLGKTQVFCMGTGYDVPATVTYRRMDVAELLSKYTKPLIVDGLANGYLSPSSPLWGVINSQLPLEISPLNFDVLISLPNVKLLSVSSSLALFGEMSMLSTNSAVQPVKIADVYARNGSDTRDIWFVVKDTSGGEVSLYPYGQHYVCTNSTWYLVNQSTVNEYSDPRYSSHVAAIYKIPAGATVPSGVSIVLEKGANPKWMAGNSAVYLSNGYRINTLTVREEVGLPADLRFALAGGTDKLGLVID